MDMSVHEEVVSECNLQFNAKQLAEERRRSRKKQSMTARTEQLTTE